MLKVFFFLSTCIFLFGCNPSKLKIEENIKKMQSKSITIPINHLDYWTNDSLLFQKVSTKAEIKLVVYIDSTKCSMCYISKQFLWKDVLKLERDYNSRFSIYFIVEPSQEHKKEIYKKLNKEDLIHPIYIDTLGAFAKTNPNIPKETMYHTFLLDYKNNVLFVGNPIGNSIIKEKILGIIKEQISNVK